MYLKLQKKLPASMLASYHRWVYENHRIEHIEVLREWVIQEAEFQVKALETVQGISYSKSSKFEENVTTKPAREHPRTFFGKSNSSSEMSSGLQSNRPCRVCGGSHGAWVCGSFKQFNITKWWECAKQNELCFSLSR